MARETPAGISPQHSALYERVKKAKPGTYDYEIKLELERLLNKIDRLNSDLYNRSGY